MAAQKIKQKVASFFKCLSGQIVTTPISFLFLTAHYLSFNMLTKTEEFRPTATGVRARPRSTGDFEAIGAPSRFF